MVRPPATAPLALSSAAASVTKSFGRAVSAARATVDRTNSSDAVEDSGPFPRWFPRLQSQRPSTPAFIYLLPVPVAGAEGEASSLSLSAISVPPTPSLSSPSPAHQFQCIDTAIRNDISLTYIFSQHSPPQSLAALACQYLHAECVRRKMTVSIQRSFDEPADCLRTIIGHWFDSVSHTGVFSVAIIGDCQFIDSVGAMLGSMNALRHTHYNAHSFAPVQFDLTRTISDSGNVSDSECVSACPSYTPFTMVEWQLSVSAIHAIHPDTQSLYQSLDADNQTIIDSANDRPVTPSMDSYDWSAVLPASVLPLLSLPNTNLPPLTGLSLPSHRDANTASMIARHCRTFTRHAYHCVYTVTLLPIELSLVDDDSDSADDSAYIRRSLARMEATSDIDTDSLNQTMFDSEWDVYDSTSKYHCLLTISRLAHARVISRFAATGQSTFINDSEIGRATAKFLDQYTGIECQWETLPLQSSVRAYHKLLSEPAGHSMIVIGSYSMLWPLCLMLVNGSNTSTDVNNSNSEALAPKDEVKGLFERCANGALNLSVWDPPSALNAAETACVNTWQAQQQSSELALATSRDAGSEADQVRRWSQQRTHPIDSYCNKQPIFTLVDAIGEATSDTADASSVQSSPLTAAEPVHKSAPASPMTAPLAAGAVSATASLLPFLDATVAADAVSTALDNCALADSSGAQ